MGLKSVSAGDSGWEAMTTGLGQLAAQMPPSTGMMAPVM
jgi:hypothetical protein